MRIDNVGYLKYLDKCGDEGALVELILVRVLALPAASDCAHMGITAVVSAHLWFTCENPKFRVINLI
jgi:hypothetical protein